MKLPKQTKVIGGVLSAIAVGAVGSGVWQYILDPVVSASSKAILELATLGAESFKNDLYREIAKGFHERASNALYIHFNLLIGVALIVLPLTLIKSAKRIAEQKSRLAAQLERIEKGNNSERPSIDTMRQRLHRIRPERLYRTLYVLVAVGIVLFSAQFVVSKRERYVDSAVTHYFQLKRIISPYVSAEALNRLDSRFAQIQTPHDYKEVVYEMTSIASKNAAAVPEFEVWQ